MSELRFVFGPSGSGKSTRIYQEILDRAALEPDRNFLVVVPDQFTMQTQGQLVRMSGSGGILNIDVLSFGRLTHRILEEVGTDGSPVLDDTGKSLVLQRVAGGMTDRLPVLGRRMHRQGYIHEVKSAISEFMQYGISPEQVGDLIRMAGDRRALGAKLADLQSLYRGFREYLQGKFITTEEQLDVLRAALPKSAILPGAVVVFDGFTGFTPIQFRVIRDLMRIVDETVMTLCIGEGEDAFAACEPQDLFFLSHKTASILVKMAEEEGLGRGQDLYCHSRISGTALAHLENTLFRGAGAVYRDPPEDQIRLLEMTTPAEEVHQVGLEIRKLVREQGLEYRDIAVVSGDLAGYGPYVEREFGRLEIPFYLDRTSGIRLNPATELIDSVLDLYLKNFSYEAVGRVLHAGLLGLQAESMDRLEEYLRETGIRGRKNWESPFVRTTARMKKLSESRQNLELEDINGLRRTVLEKLQYFQGRKRDRVSQYVEQLYDLMVGIHMEEGLAEYEAYFASLGDSVRGKEYAQIYQKICELLDQIYSLLGEEEISLQEFREILDAGFGEIRIGTIPLNVDRVVVGDMERSRLSSRKVLFFMGVNDGNIPKNSGGGGILSDLEREFLQEEGAELAPTPRQEMYTQRLYLYLNMTKPLEKLVVSYSAQASGGASLRPSYLVETLKSMFPTLKTEYPEVCPVSERIAGRRDGLRYLAEQLREYAAGSASVKESEVCALYQAYGQETSSQFLVYDAAFRRYLGRPLSEETALALYGGSMVGSVSSLETYAECPYHYFLQYGLGLRESRKHEVTAADQGNVSHAVLQEFAEGLRREGLQWRDVSDEQIAESIGTLLQKISAGYESAVYHDSGRNRYRLDRLQEILYTAICTLREHLRQGDFRPESYELPFRQEYHLEGNGQEVVLELVGKIDRVDVADCGGKRYIKIMDYKTGNRSFRPEKVLNGRSIQLPLYLYQELQGRSDGKLPEEDLRPAAILYYHVADNVTSSVAGDAPDHIDKERRKKLKMEGVVNGSSEVVVRLDHALAESAGTIHSEIVPVTVKQGIAATGEKVLGEADLRLLGEYAMHKALQEALEIYGGRIVASPWAAEESRQDPGSCAYCKFRESCGFDVTLPGYCRREPDDQPRKIEDILEIMRGELGGEKK